MEEEEPQAKHRKNKKKDQDNRMRRYWRKMLQVNDWMLEVPDNLTDFYVAGRPDGNKVLAIFQNYRLELRDKSGGLVLSCETNGKQYDKSVFEAYFNADLKTLVLSDLIVWKGNPMTSSEFEFRCAWLVSNLNLASLRAWTGIGVFFASYHCCNVAGLKQAYSGELLYPREGLLFVHKDSFYLHGLNPNVLVWKDAATSKYLQAEIE
jgi:snurportin-1